MYEFERKEMEMKLDQESIDYHFPFSRLSFIYKHLLVVLEIKKTNKSKFSAWVIITLVLQNDLNWISLQLLMPSFNPFFADELLEVAWNFCWINFLNSLRFTNRSEIGDHEERLVFMSLFNVSSFLCLVLTWGWNYHPNSSWLTFLISLLLLATSISAFDLFSTHFTCFLEYKRRSN